MLCHCQELKRKRVALGVAMDVKGLVICDAAAVHSCSLYDKIRARFEVEANCIMLHGGPWHHVVVPGGWGATGAPNDAWHQWFHYMRRGYMRCAVGMSASSKLRTAMQNLDLAVDGNTRISSLELA